MDQRGGMQQFDGGPQRDQPVLGAAQHVADQQAQGRTDAFAAGGQDLFKGRAQVWMAVVRLCVQASLDKINLLLYGR